MIFDVNILPTDTDPSNTVGVVNLKTVSKSEEEQYNWFYTTFGKTCLLDGDTANIKTNPLPLNPIRPGGRGGNIALNIFGRLSIINYYKLVT